MEVLLGCDPELFVKNSNHGGFHCAHGLIPGTKIQPHPVKNGAVQVDGMALEFNIDPAKDITEWMANINSVRTQLQAMVPGYSLETVPVADFDQRTMDHAPFEAKELGCEPDFNAWNGAPNPRPDGTVNFRTASGHIHVGWTEDADVRSVNHTADCVAVVKQLDYTLGIYSLLWDPDNRRRSLYGRAGAYRPKQYGVEYRVLSNAWLKDERLTRWVYNAAIVAVNELEKGNRFYEMHGDLAQSIINDNIVDWHTKYKLGIPVPTPPGLKELKVA
jgi:hypothetical protein